MHQKRKIVLVVESDPDLQQLIVDFIESDYATITADNADDGVESAWGWRPDLIVCDCHLPGRNGLWLVQAVRHYRELANVPVILLSEHPQVEAEVRFGVTVVNKPCPMDQLMDAVHAALGAVPA